MNVAKNKKMQFYKLLYIAVLIGCSINSMAQLSMPDKKSFRFFINSDPQMGSEKTEKKDLGILNKLLENFVTEVNLENSLNPVDFVVYNGDLVWDSNQPSYDNFSRIVSGQKVPTVLVHGNHDGGIDDPKFFEAQQKLSNYSALNYSFEYGDWHFVVIGAQEKYLDDIKKQEQLEWLESELLRLKDKKVMLFMHYHILPVGLSQMEFYTYWPIDFKNKILEKITQYGNVKYVYSGHVHIGIKASIKSSKEYKGVKFINVPTPVMARPFGEEYQEFESDSGEFKKRGFYLEVKVDRDNVELIGHKINHDHSVQYPENFYKFKANMDSRSFLPESQTKPNKKLLNPEFKNGMRGWKKSFRYRKDENNSFRNTVIKNENRLTLSSPTGNWSFDEYMETYQLVNFDFKQPNTLRYEFETPEYDRRGSGGYIRIEFFSKTDERLKTLLFHWGIKEKSVRLVHRSWYYNATGDRPLVGYIDKEIKNNKYLSMPMKFSWLESNLLDINLNKVLKELGVTEEGGNLFSHISIAHGVWTKIRVDEEGIMSKLNVKSVELSHEENESITSIIFNNKPILVKDRDIVSPYFRYNVRP